MFTESGNDITVTIQDLAMLACELNIVSVGGGGRGNSAGGDYVHFDITGRYTESWSPALRHGQPGGSHQSPHPPGKGEPAGEAGWKPGQWNLKLTQSDDKVFPLELDLSHPN